jgi:hypothetical protein
LAALISEGARSSASKKTRVRLRTMAEFYLVNRDAMDSAHREWIARK